MDFVSPHLVLGVPLNADEAAIRARYRELARTHHPDRGGNTEEFIRIRV
ncbi:MAG TPA: J domain-containing protein, partial [Planctomycetia bacterium]|nr:J domain-containing protein [Planctomycetia bacterium]